MNKKVVLSVLSATFVASVASSAFAAPKDGLYIGGNVDKYYSIETLFGLTAEGKAQFGQELAGTDFNNLVFVDFDGKGASIQEILDNGLDKAKQDPLVADDFEASYSIAKADGTVDGTYDARKDVDGVTPGELKVESVSAINLNQVKVTFNAKLDKDTAEDEANYKIDGAALDTDGAGTDDSVELSADGKSVIINLDGATGDFTQGSAHKLTVTGVKSESGAELSSFETSFYVNDTVAPTVTKVSANATGNGFIVTFDEPVHATPEGVAKINGVPAVVTPVATDKYSVEVKLASPVALEAGKSYSVYVSAVKDRAGNTSAATTKSYTHTVDTVAPTLTSVTQKDDDTLAVKFSEKLDSTALPRVTVYRDTNKFFDTQLTVGMLDTTDSTGTTYLVDLDPTAGLGGGQVLYPTGQTSTTVKVDVASFKDQAGNVAPAQSKTVDLNKTTVAPSVTATKWDGSNVVVTFDKTLDASSVNNAKVLITDETGAEVSGYTVTVDADGKAPVASANGKYVIIQNLSANKTYTVNLLAGFAKDTSVVPNETAAKTFTISTPSTAGDTTKPEIETDAGTGADPNTLDELAGASANGTKVTATQTSNVIEVLFSEPVAASTSAANFKLDGASLPSGSVVTLVKGAQSNDNRIAKITLPESAVSFDGNYELTVTGVKDLAGNTIDTTSVIVALKDTVDPTLKSVKVNTDNTLTLTFDEAIKSSTLTGSEADFIITVNGVDLATTAYTITDDATADDAVIKVTFNGVNVVGQTVKVTTADTPANVTDNSSLANPIKGKVTVQ